MPFSVCMVYCTKNAFAKKNNIKVTMNSKFPSTFGVL